MNNRNSVSVDLSSVYSIATATLVDTEEDSDNLYGTPITQTQIDSGEISYLLGWTLKGGELAFADKNALTARKYTYQVEGQTDVVRYTDSTGKVNVFDAVLLLQFLSNTL